MADRITPRASRGIGPLVAGIVLLVVGLGTFALFATVVTPSSADPEPWRALVWVAAALATAAGAALVVLSIARRRRRQADGGSEAR